MAARFTAAVVKDGVSESASGAGFCLSRPHLMDLQLNHRFNVNKLLAFISTCLFTVAEQHKYLHDLIIIH